MNGTDRILELRPDQVWDPGKGNYFVGVTVSKRGDRIERFKGRIVHEDAYGKKFIVT